jgi:hypothetical protein
MAGKEQNQNKKNDKKSLEFVPEPCMVSGMSSKPAQMLRIIKYTQVPPIQDCTPYHTHAIAARLNTGHREPQMPNEERATTGNPMW